MNQFGGQIGHASMLPLHRDSRPKRERFPQRTRTHAAHSNMGKQGASGTARFHTLRDARHERCSPVGPQTLGEMCSVPWKEEAAERIAGAHGCRRRAGRSLPRARLMVVLYHRVLDIGAEDDYPADPELISATPRDFETQMSFVRRHFNVIRFAQVIDAMDRGVALPPRSLLITFDDGHFDNYAHAFPSCGLWACRRRSSSRPTTSAPTGCSGSIAGPTCCTAPAQAGTGCRALASNWCLTVSLRDARPARGSSANSSAFRMPCATPHSRNSRCCCRRATTRRRLRHARP